MLTLPPHNFFCLLLYERIFKYQFSEQHLWSMNKNLYDENIYPIIFQKLKSILIERNTESLLIFNLCVTLQCKYAWACDRRRYLSIHTRLEHYLHMCMLTPYIRSYTVYGIHTHTHANVIVLRIDTKRSKMM